MIRSSDSKGPGIAVRVVRGEKGVQDQRQDLSYIARAEKAKASRGALHKASISGQHETVKMLLDSGEDVDQRDQFCLTPLHLACWYGQESVVKLLLEHGANVNAVDRFQRTPLQKAERHNHQFIVQLLLRNNANPSNQQPLSLKSLARKAFLKVDRRSGFNLLQAAVFEGDYNIVYKAYPFLANIVKEMTFETTGDKVKLFPGKTAVKILSNLKGKGQGHAKIDKFYLEQVELIDKINLETVGKYHTLIELLGCVGRNNDDDDDAEKAVELVLNDFVDVNTLLCNRTPLLWASPSSSFLLMKTLVDLGADVNAQGTDDKETPLKMAAHCNNFMAAHLLLENGADPNIQCVHENTALLSSVLKGHENLVKLLLENNADANIQNTNGNAPLHFSGFNGHENLVKLLLENNADANTQNTDGNTPLHCSVFKGHKNLVKLLLENNADANIQNTDGNAPLHRSAHQKSRSNINQRNKKGRTPLYVAVQNKHEQLIKLLLESNADVSMKYQQYPILYLHLGRFLFWPKWTYIVVKKNLLGLFQKKWKTELLEDFGTVVESGWGKNPPENKSFAKIQKKVDAMFPQIPGNTLVHVASRNDNTEIIDLLVKYGADVNARDAEGFTPLHVAAIHGNIQVVKKLVDLEADVNLSTADGKDAVDLAHLNEEAEIEEYLKSKMAASSQRTKEQEVGQGATCKSM